MRLNDMMVLLDSLYVGVEGTFVGRAIPRPTAKVAAQAATSGSIGGVGSIEKRFIFEGLRQFH